MPRATTLLATTVSPDFLHAKVQANEPLSKAELRTWKGWSHSTIDRYCALGMPRVQRPGMRDMYLPARINAWLAGEEPQRPAPRRGRPRKHAAVRLSGACAGQAV